MNSYYIEIEISGTVKSELELNELQDLVRNNIIDGKIDLKSGSGKIHIDFGSIINASIDETE